MCISGNPHLVLSTEHHWVHCVKQLDVDLVVAARNSRVLGCMVGQL